MKEYDVGDLLQKNMRGSKSGGDIDEKRFAMGW